MTWRDDREPWGCKFWMLIKGVGLMELVLQSSKGRQATNIMWEATGWQEFLD